MSSTVMKRSRIRPISVKQQARQERLNELKLLVIKEQYGHCNRCMRLIRVDGIGVDLHHRIKRSLGGDDTRENLEALCQPCHRIEIHLKGG